MNKYINESKAKQVSAAQQTQKGSQTVPLLGTPTHKEIAKQAYETVAFTPMHKEIARRAYEIYLENGRKQGQSEQYWLQAEQELKNRKHWRQADEK